MHVARCYIYKPEVCPLRIPSWEIVFGSCSIYADVVKPPSELGAPEEPRMRRGKIRHENTDTSTHAAYLQH